MLLELEVSGFALVDHLVLEFGPGLTVMTGETGTGKSLVLDSLAFLLGGTARLPDGTKDCRVAGHFRPNRSVRDYLESQGLPVDEDELLIQRERRGGGRTTSRLNGSLVSVAQLKELSAFLIDFQGQHQSYALTRPSTHLPMLDRLAGAPQAEELTRYSQLYADRSSLLGELAELRRAERHRLREIEWLRREAEEIDRVAPVSGEEEELRLELVRLAGCDDLMRGAMNAVTALSTDGGGLDALRLSVIEVEAITALDPSLNEVCERLRQAKVEVTEVARELAGYADRLEHDPLRLDALQERLDHLERLKRKFGETLAEVIEHRHRVGVTLERLEHHEEHEADLERRLDDVMERLKASAQVLAERRYRAAYELQEKLMQEFQALGFASARFEVRFQELLEPGPHGCQQGEFMFSANAGCATTPLAETASGGELSRLMLGLVAVLSRYQRQPTLIFDEIDAGLGGRTASLVAEKLCDLAKRAQVLCVTHLAVVAAVAEGHYVIEKQTGLDGTKVSARQAQSGKRVEEIARMLSGDSSPETAQRLAIELLTWKKEA